MIATPTPEATNAADQPVEGVGGQVAVQAEQAASNGHKAELVQRADRQQRAAEAGAATDAERIAIKVAAYRQEVALWNRVAQTAVVELRSGIAPTGSVLDLLDFVQGKIKATESYNVQ